MKRLLVLAALIAAPLGAHATNRAGIPTPNAQMKQSAQQDGLMKRGSGDRLKATPYYVAVEKNGAKELAGFHASVLGTTGLTGSQRVVRATATFKVAGRSIDGVILKPVDAKGEKTPWAFRLYSK